MNIMQVFRTLPKASKFVVLAPNNVARKTSVQKVAWRLQENMRGFAFHLLLLPLLAKYVLEILLGLVGVGGCE